MTKPANTTDLSRLPAIYRQWERVEDRRQAMTKELKNLFKDARDEGYNPKSMRVAFKEIYRVNHQTFDEAEKREKADAEAEVYMLALARVRESDPDHDPITGEIIDTNSADPTHVAADQSTGNVDGSAGRSRSGLGLSTESPASVPVDTNSPEGATQSEAVAPEVRDMLASATRLPGAASDTNSNLQHEAGDRADTDPHSLVGSSNSHLQDDLGDQAGAAAAGLSNTCDMRRDSLKPVGLSIGAADIPHGGLVG